MVIDADVRLTLKKAGKDIVMVQNNKRFENQICCTKYEFTKILRGNKR